MVAADVDARRPLDRVDWTNGWGPTSAGLIVFSALSAGILVKFRLARA